MNDHVPIKLYLQKEVVRHIWPERWSSLLTPAANHRERLVGTKRRYLMWFFLER